MFFSSVTRAVSSRLAVKLVLVVILLLSIVSILLTFFFIQRQKKLLTEELHKRTELLANNLAYDSKRHLYPLNTYPLMLLVSGLRNVPDVENVLLTDENGKVVAYTNNEYRDTTISLPEEADQNDDITSIPSQNKERLIVPIDKDIPLLYRNNELMSFSKSRNPEKGPIPINFFFPSFRNDHEITFTASFGGANNPLATLSISLNDFKLNFFRGASCNGTWSRSGRYFAFFNLNSGKLSLYDSKNDKNSDLYNPRNVGIHCFTTDEKYVITTDHTKNGDEKFYRIPREGGIPEQFTFNEGRHWFPSCSPDGKWIMYTILNEMRLSIYNTEIKKSYPIFPELDGLQCCGSISPDGRKFCYLRTLEGDFEVFVADFYYDREHPVSDSDYGTRLTYTGGHKRITNWSPDGKWIAYGQKVEVNLNDPSNICIVSSEGGEPRNLITEAESRRKRLGYVILDVSLENLHGAIRTGNYIAFLITLIMLGIGSITAIVLVRNIINPVRNLADSVRKVGKGDFTRKVPATRSDEIGVLTESFNQMTEQLHTSREEIIARNRELEKANIELKSLDKAKDDFLSLVSHEIRTPLATISLHTEMLLNGIIVPEEKQNRFHANILENCERLTRLINNVLDISKIEAGRMKFTMEPLNIRELVESTVSGFDTVLESRQIHCEYKHIPDNLYLNGDRDRIVQVLTNILSNAIRFTPPQGEITISANSDGEYCTIAVKDTGKGIHEEDIPKVFDKFSQLEKIEHHSVGTGLGMAITKSIIEHHGGSIRIESEFGSGTTVFFTLPVAQIPSEIEPEKEVRVVSSHINTTKPSEENGAGNIVIADDETQFRMALRECIEHAGYLPVEAASGKEALLLMEKHRPLLVILDVMMPDMSGLEVCRILRNDHRYRGLKIIILSAKGQEKEKEEGIKAGADRYISKPFNYSNLLETIGELLS